MAVTYFQSAVGSDLTGPNGTGGITNNQAAATSADGLDQSLATGNMNSGIFCNKNFFTPSGNPGTNGATGDYTVIVRVTVQNANIGIRVFLRRYDSGGNPQGSDVEASEGSQTAGAASRTFTWTSASLGTWASGDRLLVRVQLTNTSGSMNQACSIGVGTSADTIDTPFTAGGGPVALDGTTAAVIDAAGALNVLPALTGAADIVVDAAGALAVEQSLTGTVDAIIDQTGALDVGAGPIALTGAIATAAHLAAALATYPTDIIDGGDTATPPTDIIVSSLLGEPVTDLAGVLTVTGGEQALDGVIAAIADLAGATQLAVALAGPTSSIAELAGDLTVQAPGSQALNGVIAAISDLAGDLSVQAPTQHSLDGAVAVVADLAGELTVEAPGQQALIGTVVVVADTAGTAQTAAALSGPVAAIIDLAGAIGVAVPLQATSGSVADLAGDLTVQAPGQQELAGTIATATDLAGSLTAAFVVQAVNDIVVDLEADLTVILWGFNEPNTLDLTGVDDSNIITVVDDAATLTAVPDNLTLVAVTED